jgi:colicin import membrane protein
MLRKLKTYQTSLGFYDMAIAAPSMKAALEAWGAKSNLFHQGIARESHDPEVIAAAMSKPGVIVRRPVGSRAPFGQRTELPKDLVRDSSDVRPKKARARPKQAPPPTVNDRAARKAALAFEREERRRERERRKEEAARGKERERRDQAVAKAQTALDEGEREHAGKSAAIEAERTALEQKAQIEQARWERQKKKLEIALQRARGQA